MGLFLYMCLYKACFFKKCCIFILIFKIFSCSCIRYVSSFVWVLSVHDCAWHFMINYFLKVFLTEKQLFKTGEHNANNSNFSSFGLTWEYLWNGNYEYYFENIKEWSWWFPFLVKQSASCLFLSTLFKITCFLSIISIISINDAFVWGKGFNCYCGFSW